MLLLLLLQLLLLRLVTNDRALRRPRAPKVLPPQRHGPPFRPRGEPPSSQRRPLQLPHGGRVPENRFRRDSSGRRGGSAARRGGGGQGVRRAGEGKDAHAPARRRRDPLRRGRGARGGPGDGGDVPRGVEGAGLGPAEERGAEEPHAGAAALVGRAGPVLASGAAAAALPPPPPGRRPDGEQRGQLLARRPRVLRPPAQRGDWRGRRRGLELRLELPSSRRGQRKRGGGGEGRRRSRGCCRCSPCVGNNGASEQQRSRRVDPHDAVPPAHREARAVDRWGERERRGRAEAARLKRRRLLPEA